MRCWKCTDRMTEYVRRWRFFCAWNQTNARFICRLGSDTCFNGGFFWLRVVRTGSIFNMAAGGQGHLQVNFISNFVLVVFQAAVRPNTSWYSIENIFGWINFIFNKSNQWINKAALALINHYILLNHPSVNYSQVSTLSQFGACEAFVICP